MVLPTPSWPYWFWPRHHSCVLLAPMKQATWLLTAPSVNSTLLALTDKGKKA